MSIAKEHQSKLEELKNAVRNSREFFDNNYKMFNEFRNFVFKSSLNSDDISLLKTLKKPQLEFNVLEAFISRLRGEFSKQEPAFEVRAAEGKPINPALIDLVEMHLRAQLKKANKDGFEYNVYTDLLSGGFSAVKIYTDYARTMGFEQNICFERAYDPTLCGWDPMAAKPHKGDGRYCFELFPKTAEEFQKENPDVNLDQVSFQRDVEGFSWSYKNNNEDILLVCDYYTKKTKRVKIHRLADGRTVTAKEYKEELAKYQDPTVVTVAPAIVESRFTKVETICRYRFIETEVLEYTETDYNMLPLIFVDGNSQMIREGTFSTVQQVCRPYVYHAKGAQRLKNFAGQTWANELENMVMHKFKVPKEGIPADYKDAYLDVQKASVLVYNQFKDNDPNVRLDPPQEVARVPAPPEVMGAFTMTDQLVQTILGSYDASLGINDNQLSGVAIVEGASQSNSTAMPYIVGFLHMLSRLAACYVDLMPKYMKTPRTIPIQLPDGQHTYFPINQKGGLNVDYGADALDVIVEAGVNFQVQQQRAFSQMINLMQVSPIFAQFMNQEGLPVLLDNLDFRGVDQLKESAKGFMAQLKQQAQMPNPEMIRLQLEKSRLQQEAQQDQAANQLKAAQISIDQESVLNERSKILLQAHQAHNDNIVQLAKAQTEQMAKATDMAIKEIDVGHKATDQAHRHAKETIELHHQLMQPQQEGNNE